MLRRKVKLPTTLEEFDALVDLLVKKYKLADKHHAAAIMSVAIRHIPNEQAYTTLDYLHQYISKNLANYVAYHRGETLKHEAQVTNLVDILQLDPANNQAMDELIKAAEGGSDMAKSAIAKLTSKSDPPPPTTEAQVLPN